MNILKDTYTGKWDWPFVGFLFLVVSGVSLLVYSWYPISTAEYIRAPIQYCTRTATGRTQDSTYMQCQPSGKNPCAWQIPITSTYNEYVYECRWSQFEETKKQPT